MNIRKFQIPSIVAMVSMFLPASALIAQTPANIAAKPGDSADKIVDTFFSFLEKNQVDQAYDALINGTKIAENPDEVLKLKTTTKDAIRLFGDITGYELITVKTAGTHLICSTYLSLGKGYPMRWKFYFYRWDKTWRLIDIRVDDRLVDMFDDNLYSQPASPATGQ